MEQAVWFYVGIIAALIGIGLLVSVVLMGTNLNKEQLAQNSVRLLQMQCNNVCNNDVGTLLGVDVDIGSGTLVESTGNVICSHYNQRKECRECNCEVFAPGFSDFELNLATPEALELFDIHTYHCTFEKVFNHEKEIYVVLLRCAG